MNTRNVETIKRCTASRFSLVFITLANFFRRWLISAISYYKIPADLSSQRLFSDALLTLGNANSYDDVFMRQLRRLK